MLFGVYSVRDVRTGFLRPEIESNDSLAMRNFSHAVMSSNSTLQSFAQEYDLYKIGTFDSESGKLESLDPVEFLCSGSSVLLASAEKGN